MGAPVLYKEVVPLAEPVLRRPQGRHHAIKADDHPAGILCGIACLGKRAAAIALGFEGEGFQGIGADGPEAGLLLLLQKGLR